MPMGVMLTGLMLMGLMGARTGARTPRRRRADARARRRTGAQTRSAAPDPCQGEVGVKAGSTAVRSVRMRGDASAMYTVCSSSST